MVTMAMAEADPEALALHEAEATDVWRHIWSITNKGKNDMVHNTYVWMRKRTTHAHTYIKLKHNIISRKRSHYITS